MGFNWGRRRAREKRDISSLLSGEPKRPQKKKPFAGRFCNVPFANESENLRGGGAGDMIDGRYEQQEAKAFRATNGGSLRSR